MKKAFDLLAKKETRGNKQAFGGYADGNRASEKKSKDWDACETKFKNEAEKDLQNSERGGKTYEPRFFSLSIGTEGRK